MKCPLWRIGATSLTAKLGAKRQFKQTHQPRTSGPWIHGSSPCMRKLNTQRSFLGVANLSDRHRASFGNSNLTLVSMGDRHA